MSEKLIILIILFLQFLQFSTQLRPIKKPFFDYNYDADYDNEFTMLISGGFRPPQNKFVKYMVSIRTAKSTEFFGDNHYCAGVIVAARAVVTAAHCVVDSRGIQTRPRRVKVVAGTEFRLNPVRFTDIVDVEEIIAHENYERRGKNDIAILRLKEQLPDGNEHIKIIILAKERLKKDKQCAVIGWGRLFHKGPYANQAVQTNLKVFANSTCKNVYEAFYEDGMLCAGDKGDLEKGVCRGDSGSPLICDNLLYGIVSWNDDCVDENKPTVFTDIVSYREWIISVSGIERIQAVTKKVLGTAIILRMVLQKFCLDI